ncbi:hypothetical protein FZEAL_4146 [Fusarium zealandicum]|uniref:HNH nuclease domain-containing protein n=1 Tax=Fusarium zealandicum TaxID=1053134 RepID=A0A8H4XL31_9HYPO|nr:hypothetical protein FZEAL_4146 [Fusarium zealandicum]
MSNAAVTPQMRAHGWNISFLADVNASQFAGVFQNHCNGFLTFRDVVDELRLCFELPDAQNGQDAWDGIAFGLVNRGQPSIGSSLCPPLVTDLHLDIQVPSLPYRDPHERAMTRYHLVRHSRCDLSPNAPLDAHLRARCATHIRRPVRRPEPRYLAPKKPSPDPRIARIPLRRNARTRTDSQSPKRPASGSASPTRDGPQDEQVVSAMVAPPNMNVNPEHARKTISQFRAACLVGAGRCAVSGKGKSWCISPAIGPALQACHIVPQQHYHLYPDPCDSENNEQSLERLRNAWVQTWSASNGILLMSHLHELFDARLLSIHPETLLIRAFVPYDVLTEYHGAEARVPDYVDRNALRHHYEMSCIENMAATMPSDELVAPPPASRTATSGTTSPFTSRSDLPMTPGHDGRDDVSLVRVGDPSKRSRSNQDGPADRAAGSQVLPQDGENVYRIDVGVHKRRRVEGFDLDSSDTKDVDWAHNDVLDSYITPLNCRAFLADVNWKLAKLTDNP